MTDLVSHRGAERVPVDRAPSAAVLPLTPTPAAFFHTRTERPTRRGWRKQPPTEFALGNALSELAPGWIVLRTFDVFGELDTDFLVIGPPGVFAISARIGANKKVWVDEDFIWVNGRPTDHVSKTRLAARRASVRLSAAVAEDVRVIPIIALIDPATLSFGGDPAKRVVVLSVDIVSQWLSECSRAYSDEAVAYFTMVAEERATWGSQPSELGPVARLR
ncbi:MAG: hypothetical protein JWN09_2210 [Microbacteriaceae bacterium]|jgi:hypothetical protein|nr:hypothetical protein [Microbacteriaceae bacterium]